MDQTSVWRKSNARHHLHPFTDQKSLNASGVNVITRASGNYVWDSFNHKLFDGMSGLWNVNIGHGRAEVISAICKQLETLDFYNTFFNTTHPAVVELGELLADVAPEGFSRSFYTGSGSEANDSVIRLVRHYWSVLGKPSKRIVISRKNGYHGSTIGGASLSGMPAMHKQGNLPIPDIVHVRQPYWWQEGGNQDPQTFAIECAENLAKTIDALGAENVAAFIGEPIQCAGGVIPPPSSYWKHVERICREQNVLIVSDEVITGFGRTGQWFGCQTYDFKPDLMPVAKGITSGYFPLGAVLMSDGFSDVLVDKGGSLAHGFTNSAHPGACAAAIANIRVIREEKLAERVRNDIGPYLQEAWSSLGRHDLVGEARGVGLLAAIELTANKDNRTRFTDPAGAAGLLVRDLAYKRGLVVRPLSDRIVVAPPFTTTRVEVDTMIDVLLASLDDAKQALSSQPRAA